MKVTVECPDCGQRGRIALAKVSDVTRCKCGSRAFDLALEARSDGWTEVRMYGYTSKAELRRMLRSLKVSYDTIIDDGDYFEVVVRASDKAKLQGYTRGASLGKTSAFRIIVPGQGMTSNPYVDEELAISEAQRVGSGAYVVYEGFDEGGMPGDNRVVWTPRAAAASHRVARDDQLDSSDLLCPMCGGTGNYPSGTNEKCPNCGGDGKVDRDSEYGSEEWDEATAARVAQMARLAKADNPHLSLRSALSLAKDALERFG